MKKRKVWWFVFLCWTFLVSIGWSQGVLISEMGGRLPRPIPIPVPVRPSPLPSSELAYRIQQLEVNAHIRDSVAKVHVSQTFVNTGKRPIEVSFLFPLPYDGVVEGMVLLVDGKEFPAKLLSAEEARKTYEKIVRKSQDPALLEWMGTGIYQSHVFPIPAGASRTVMLEYTQLCRTSEGMTDFLFPLRTARYTAESVEKVLVRVTLEGSVPLRNIYSPSQELKIEKPSEKMATVRWEMENAIPDTDFRLIYDVGKEVLQPRVLSYRPQALKGKKPEEGYFLILATPEISAQKEKSLPKTVFLVIDNSGSMMGKKIEQARDAAKFVIQQLKDGDVFNILVFNHSVTQLQPEMLTMNAENRQKGLAFVEGIYASGGTDIHSALLSALKLLEGTDTQRPNYLLFLTDGCPTVGECNETRIAEAVRQANRPKARIFAFGAGYDLNSRLLDKLVAGSFGQSEYIRPDENIEERISRLYRKLHSPVMTEVRLEFLPEECKDTPKEGMSMVNRLYPKDSFDLFAGDLMVVSGRYRVPGKGALKVTGKMENGDEKTFSYPLDFVEESPDATYAFVEKLWAVRRIGEILDVLDLQGKNEELVQELLQLATCHGILTPYTSFLAEDAVSLQDAPGNLARASGQVEALKETEGTFGISQRAFKGSLKRATNAMQMNIAQQAYDSENAAPQAISGTALAKQKQVIPQANKGMAYSGMTNIQSVQQKVRNIHQKVFFFKEGVWVDTSLTAEQQKAKPQVIHSFSEEYFALIQQYEKEITPYLVFDESVLLNVQNQVYRIEY